MLQLGFVSAILADKSFEEVIDFASAHGFACVELMCWPKGGADQRRYAGVTHIDVDNLDNTAIAHIQSYLKAKNVFISGLGYYPNPLDPAEEKAAFYRQHLVKIIDAAVKLGVPVVNTFIGRHPQKTVEENLSLYHQHWPAIIQKAIGAGIKIGIENCPMLFTADEWPGGKNLAVSPAIWDKLFEADRSSNTLGLNFDPSHFIWQQMDYIPVLKDYKDKLWHIHLKDAKVYPEKLNRVGIMATPLEYHSPKLPGLGDVDWAAFFAQLKAVNYNGPVVIEFEDKAYEGSYQLIEKGMLQARDHVKQFI
jgi:sugar phosphate isomerase/epimerase